MEEGGVSVVQLIRALRARLNLALNELRPARRDIKAILASDPNSPHVRHLHLGLLQSCIWAAVSFALLHLQISA